MKAIVYLKLQCCGDCCRMPAVANVEVCRHSNALALPHPFVDTKGSKETWSRLRGANSHNLFRDH